MSQIDYEFISLEELINESGAIFLVRKNDPFEQVVEIPLSKKHPDKYPFHRRVMYHFTVFSPLYTIYTVPAETNIIVHRANEAIDFELEKLYYIDGVEESPVYFAFQPDIDMYTADTLIIFVNKIPDTDNEYRFTAENAYVSPDREEEIETLLLQKEE
jgi:hypothetical protein